MHDPTCHLPTGTPLPEWQPAAYPSQGRIEGRYVAVEPLDCARHERALYAAFGKGGDDRLWAYLPVGPFPSRARFGDWLGAGAAASDPCFFALVGAAGGTASGIASYMRIKPQHGVIEVGSIVFSPALQASRAGTEAMYLLMKHAFEDCGYRRYEWKCDALNSRSRRAAERLGFSFEGIFRQAMVYKGRNRDTAWYSIIDRDWPAIRQAFEDWLQGGNFDARGQQIRTLRECRRADKTLTTTSNR